MGLLAIICGILFFFVFGRGHGSGPVNTRNVLIPQIKDKVSATETHQRRPPKQNSIQNSEGSPSNNADDFYRVIIEKNIFRPLNWKPIQQAPAYTLLGTSIPTDGDNATAYITERKTNQFFTVKVGEKIVDATVTEIQQKQVTLNKNGKTMHLYMASIPFLSRTRSSSDTSYRPPQQQIIPKSSNSQRTQPQTAKDKERTAWREAQKQRIDELKKKAEKLQEIAAEQRQRMREYNQQ